MQVLISHPWWKFIWWLQRNRVGFTVSRQKTSEVDHKQKVHSDRNKLKHRFQECLVSPSLIVQREAPQYIETSTHIQLSACSDMPVLCPYLTFNSLMVIFSGKPGVLFNEPLTSQMHSMPGNLWEVGCNWWDRPWEHSKAHFWKVIKERCLGVKALLASAVFASLDNCPSFLKSKRRKRDGRWRIGGIAADAWHHLKHSCRL